MKKFLIILPLIFLAGCEFRYRYECQDPKNWGKEWCSNDVCKADGSCTEKLIGFVPQPNQKINPNDLENTAGHENLSELKKDISKEKPDQSVNCKATVVYKDRPVSTKVERILEPREQKIVEEAPKEMPLTMNTIVDTAGHNSAIRN